MVVGLASADSKPAVTALRDQITALRKEQGTTIKAIQARYRAIRRRDRLTQAELRFERAEVRRQEDLALAWQRARPSESRSGRFTTGCGAI